MMLGFAIAIVILATIVWWIYKRYFRLNRFSDYRDRAMRYEMKTGSWEHKQEYIRQAIELRKQAGQMDGNMGEKMDTKMDAKNPMEKADNYLQIARDYKGLWDAEQAKHYFDLSWEIARHHKFPYTMQYLEFIDMYVKSGRKERALEILDDLIDHQQYNKRFADFIPYKEALLAGRWVSYMPPDSNI